MPRVVSLEPVKRKPCWHRLILHDGSQVLVNRELVIKHGLRVGEQLPAKEFDALRTEAEFAYLKAKAMDILSRRQLSEKELRRKLSAIPIYGRHAGQVIELLKKLQLLDDSQYAISLAQTLLNSGPKSKMLIKRKLITKGIPRSVIDEVMASELADYDERQAALSLAEKKLKSLAGLGVEKARRRLATFLRSRGFSWADISYCLQRLLRSENDQEFC